MISEQALGEVLGKFGADLTGADLGRLMHRFDVNEVKNMFSSFGLQPGVLLIP